MKAFLSAITLVLAPAAALAGDPCPIPITILDVGPPSWLESEALLDDLQTQQSWIGIRHRDTDGGIELTHIYPRSPASEADLSRGDVISAINGIPTTDTAAREALFDAKEAGDILQFTRVDRPPVTFQVGRIDPVPLAMTDALRKRDCHTAEISIPSPDQRTDILPKLFDENRRFRCEDAHEAIAHAGTAAGTESDVYFVRGSRRILLTMPSWGTTCIAAASLDGDNLTDAALLATLDDVIDDYVQYQIDNP